MRGDRILNGFGSRDLSMYCTCRTPPSTMRMFSACSSISASSKIKAPPAHTTEKSFMRNVSIFLMLRGPLQWYLYRKYCWYMYILIQQIPCTLNEKHLQHWCTDIQQDCLTLSDDGEHSRLGGRQATPGVLGGPDINVEEISIVLKRERTAQLNQQYIHWNTLLIQALTEMLTQNVNSEIYC